MRHKTLESLFQKQSSHNRISLLQISKVSLYAKRSVPAHSRALHWPNKKDYSPLQY